MLHPKLLLCVIPLLSLACVSSSTPPTPASSSNPADEVAARAMAFSGAQHWPTLARLQFTFNVEDEGQTILSATHDWDLVANTDTVSWAGKTVTINLAGPHSTDDEKAAFQRWTNDSYWLLAPLKLLDGGTQRKLLPEATANDRTVHVLELSFGNVGLTPSNKYHLFLDPASGRLVAWDYYANPTATPARFTWESYQKVGPLTLSTEHRALGHPKSRKITFTHLSATTR